MEWVAIIVLFLVILLICPFVLYELAKSEDPIFFATMESGDIRFIMKGKTLDRMIHDVRGKMWSDGEGRAYDAELVSGEEEKTWLQKTFGLYWIGWPPFYKVLKFNIKKTRENTAGIKPSEWIGKITQDTVSSFRQTFPMPFVFLQVELADRTKVDMLVVGTFEVVRPYVPVLQLKGDYYIRMHSRILAATSDILAKIPTLDDFIASPKSEQKGILSKLITDPDYQDFRDGLLEKLGLKLTELALPNSDAEEAMAEANRKKAIAKLEAAAVEETAKGVAKKIEIEANATASQITKIGAAKASAKTAQIGATISALNITGAKPDVVVQGAAGLLGREAIGGVDSKVTTFVEGGSNAGVVVSGGNKP